MLDRGKIGSGMTARTSAHLSGQQRRRFKTIIDGAAKSWPRTTTSARPPAITRIETIQARKASSATSAASTGSCFPDRKQASRRSTRSARRPRRPACRSRPPRIAVRGHEKTRCLRYPEPGDLPSHQISARSCALHRGARRKAVRRHPRRSASRRKDGGVAVTTGAGTDDPRQARGRGHQLADQRPRRAAFQTGAVPHLRDGAELPRGALPDALYWDTLDPYHYVRIHPGKDMISDRRRRRSQERRGRRRRDPLRGAGGLDPQSGAVTRRRDASLVGPGHGHDRLFVVQRAQSRQQERLCAHRQIPARASPTAWSAA